MRAKWQAALGHVLVDEYQDTNATQYELLKLLVGERAHFTAVGDDDQSIYGWRGATLDNLKKLPVDYPHLKVIKLEQNYRSTSRHPARGQQRDRPQPQAVPQDAVLASWARASPCAWSMPTTRSTRPSAPWPASRACARPANPTSRTWKNFAILYRANHQARPFEKALRKANIPYKVSGGTSFFDRAEIKDLCAWFRLLDQQRRRPGVSARHRHARSAASATPRSGAGRSLPRSTSEHVRCAVQRHAARPRFQKRAMDGLHEFGRYINYLEYSARRAHGAEEATHLPELNGSRKSATSSTSTTTKTARRWPPPAGAM